MHYFFLKEFSSLCSVQQEKKLYIKAECFYSTDFLYYEKPQHTPRSHRLLLFLCLLYVLYYICTTIPIIPYIHIFISTKIKIKIQRFHHCVIIEAAGAYSYKMIVSRIFIYIAPYELPVESRR